MTEPRSVVITGASRGLGLASATYLYKQGWRVVEADQLEIWHGELEAWYRFRPGSPALLRFRMGGFPAHSLLPEKGTFPDLWRVSFFHVFLPLLNDELRELAH